VLYNVLKNRESRKVPKLKDIIQDAREKQAKANEARRKRKENLSLEIKSNSQFMDDAQSQQIKEASEKIRNMLVENDGQLRVLRQKIIDNLLRKHNN
jgi:hypothetical protein